MIAHRLTEAWRTVPHIIDHREADATRLLEARDPFFAVTQQRLGPLVGAEAISSTTVRLRTRAPDAILLNRLTMLFMVPPRYTAEGGDLKSSPVGSGSFKVADYQANKSITYEAWDGSWRGKSTIQTAKIVRTLRTWLR